MNAVLSSELSVRDRVEALIPQLTVIARHVRGSRVDMDPEELLSEMTLALILKAERDPQFLNQKIGFILQYAGWSARKAAKILRRGEDRYHDIMIDEPEGDSADSLVSLGAEDLDLQKVELKEALEEAIASLDANYRKIIQLLYIGLPQVEIARILNIKPASMSNRMDTLRKYLAPALA